MWQRWEFLIALGLVVRAEILVQLLLHQLLELLEVPILLHSGVYLHWTLDWTWLKCNDFAFLDKAEIADFEHPVFRNENVAWFDVTVNDASLFEVNQGPDQLLGKFEGSKHFFSAQTSFSRLGISRLEIVFESRITQLHLDEEFQILLCFCILGSLLPEKCLPVEQLAWTLYLHPQIRTLES